VAARDALWAHPDVVPTAAALEDPLGFARSRPGDDAEMDAALAALLDAPPASPGPGASGGAAGTEGGADGGTGEAPPTGPPDADEPGAGPRPEGDR
jgi:hypothetical protein